MSKRNLLSVVLVALLMLFASCNTRQDNDAADLPSDEEQGSWQEYSSDAPAESDEPTNEAAGFRTGSPELSRGTWDGNVFTSDYLGLWIYISDDWVIATDEEIAEVLGIGAGMIGDGSFDDLLTAMEFTTMYDILLSNINTGASIQIVYERLIFPNTRMTEIQYIAQLRPMMEMIGMEFIDVSGTTRIGEYDWFSYGTRTSMHGINIHGRYFVNISDGVARAIALTYTDFSESPEDLLAMFGVIGTTPTPAPPFVPSLPQFSHPMQDTQSTALANHPLLGAWYWDADEEYIYLFLDDGSGVRGFEDTFEFFTWSIGDDDSNLLIHIENNIFQESWTFTIDGKVLTLANRQFPDMVFNYIMIPLW